MSHDSALTSASKNSSEKNPPDGEASGGIEQRICVFGIGCGQLGSQLTFDSFELRCCLQPGTQYDQQQQANDAGYAGGYVQI